MTPARMWAIGILGKMNLKTSPEQRERLLRQIESDVKSIQADAIESSVTKVPAQPAGKEEKNEARDSGRPSLRKLLSRI